MQKQTYSEKNPIARSPTLQTVIMVEEFIDENSGEFKKTELFKKLPKKVMWQTFQVVMEYLESTLKIAYDREGYVVYIWNPGLYEKYKNRKDLEWKPAIELKKLFISSKRKTAMKSISEDIDNKKLIEKFGAEPFKKAKDSPDFYTFKTGVMASHRDFDKFISALKKGKKCAILSGLNASGTLHLGHKAVFDTNLFFQKKYNLPVFIPISDDESYVSGKVETQEEALKNSLELAKQLIAYGFNPKKTYFIIDQIYTNIYNLAIKLSKKITISEIKATYGYKNEDNPGLYFYPAIQSAHILFPNEHSKIENILVPIGPDEDAHLRISRDIASRFHYKKPAVLHSKFLPGIDGQKMSKSKNNTILLTDDEKTIIKKVNKAFSGGQKSLDEHRKKGGNPDVDVSFIYLKSLFLTPKESKKLETKYKAGKITSGEMKKLFLKHLLPFIKKFQSNLKKVTKKDLEKSILKNN